MLNVDRIIKILGGQGYTFELLKKEDTGLHREFIKRVWPNSTTRGDFAINNWKLNRGRDTETINMLVCKKDGRIIGQMGYIPVTLKIGDTLYDAVWGCNFRVEDSYKDVGIGAAIEMYATKLFDILLGNTPTEEAMKFKQGLGYKFIDGPRIMMFPIKADYLIGIKAPAKLKPFLPLATLMVNPLLRIWQLFKFAGGNSSAWAQVTAEKVIDRIAKRQQSISLPYTVHDAEFINWRCNPPEQYKPKPQVLIYNNDAESYCIYNVTNKVLNLYEYCFNSKKAFDSFVKYIIAQRNKEGITTIRIYANTEAEESMFRKGNFIGLRRKCVITAYNKDNLFADTDKMYVDLYDSDGDL